MAPGGEGPNEKMEKQTNPLAEALEAAADENKGGEGKKKEKKEDKKEVDYAQIITGYPDSVDEKKSGDADFKKIKDFLEPKMVKQSKGGGKEQGDNVGGTLDNYLVFMVIDKNHDPSVRIFKSKKENEKAGDKQETEKMDKEELDKKSKGYPEVKPPNKDDVKYLIEQFETSNGKKWSNRDVSSYTEGNTEAILINDAGENRLFKGKMA